MVSRWFSLFWHELETKSSESITTVAIITDQVKQSLNFWNFKLKKVRLSCLLLMMMITCLGEKREIKLKLVFRTGFRWCATKAIIRLCIQNLLRSCTKEGGGLVCNCRTFGWSDNLFLRRFFVVPWCANVNVIAYAAAAAAAAAVATSKTANYFAKEKNKRGPG